MKPFRFEKIDNAVLDTLMDRPQSVEQMGRWFGGVTIELLLSLKKLKDKGLVHVCARGQDDHGRPVAIYGVCRTKKSAAHKGELRVTPV
jgi:hypothetical protein